MTLASMSDATLLLPVEDVFTAGSGAEVVATAADAVGICHNPFPAKVALQVALGVLELLPIPWRLGIMMVEPDVLFRMLLPGTGGNDAKAAARSLLATGGEALDVDEETELVSDKSSACCMAASTSEMPP
jgi:hypothetical protein